MPRSSSFYRRLTRILLITLAVLAVLIGGGIWWLNHWLKSAEMHAKLERELSLALKLPVKFKGVHLSWRGQLRADGISVPDRGNNFFEAPSFSAKVDLAALFHGRLAVDEILVESPKFYLVQRPNGEWKLPDLPADLQAQLGKPAAKKADSGDAKKPATPAVKSTDQRVGSIRLSNGTVELVEHGGQPFLSALAVAAKISNISQDGVEGFVSVGRLVWHGNVAAAAVKATFGQKSGNLVIQDISAEVGGGTLKGGFSQKGDQPFTLKLASTDVNISRAAMDADAQPPNLDGVLTGTLEMHGTGTVRLSYNGKADITLRDGTCREIDWVNQLSDVLQYEDVDLAAFKIKQLKADLQFARDNLIYKSVTIDAPPLRVVANNGLSKIDGTKLRIEADLLADTKFLAKRPNVSPQFGPDDGSGMRPMHFTLAGSFGKPKQNLIERLTGTSDRTEQAIKLGLDALSNLKDERKKKGAAGAAAAPPPPVVPVVPLIPAERPPPPPRVQVVPTDRPVPEAPPAITPAERPAPSDAPAKP